MKNLKVIYVYRTDPFKDEYGGRNAYMRFLTRQALQKGMKVKFIGIKLCNHINQNRNLAFIPLLKYDDRWWTYFFVSFFRVPFLKIDSDEIIHSGRLIFLLPYILFYPNNPKFITSDHPGVAAQLTYPKFLLKLLVPIFNAIEKFILKRIDGVIAAKHVLDSYYKAKYPNLKSKFKDKILPGAGLNTDLFRPLEKEPVRKLLHIAVDIKVLLFVGRMSQIKCVDFLIDVFGEFLSQTPDSRFILVGGGEDEGKILKYREEKPFKDKIIFMGVKTGQDLVKIYNCADVLLIGSAVEGNAGVLREALSCGIPVVSMDVGDAQQILDHPHIGKVVSKRDPRVFVEAIHEVLLQDKQKVREACRQKAGSFSEQTIFESIYTAYQEVLESKRDE